MENEEIYKAEEDKQLIYNTVTDEDICMYFDNKNRDFLLNLLNTYGK